MVLVSREVGNLVLLDFVQMQEKGDFLCHCSRQKRKGMGEGGLVFLLPNTITRGEAAGCRSCNHSKPWPPSPKTEELDLVHCLGQNVLMPHRWLQLLDVGFQFQSLQPSCRRAGTLALEVNKLYHSPGALEVRLSSTCLDGSGCLPHLSLLSLFSWGL